MPSLPRSLPASSRSLSQASEEAAPGITIQSWPLVEGKPLPLLKLESEEVLALVVGAPDFPVLLLLDGLLLELQVLHLHLLLDEGVALLEALLFVAVPETFG